MDGFELNKIACAILFCCLTIMGIDIGVNNFLETEHHDNKKETLTYLPEGASSNNLSVNTTKSNSIEPIEDLIKLADINAGKKIAKKCLQCHTFENGGRIKIGPNLWGIVGSKIARVKTFSYSKGLKAKNAESWTIDNLNKFLYKPRNFAKGTKMSFAGLKKTKDRANIIAYMLSNK
jgi:cytochrome c